MLLGLAHRTQVEGWSKKVTDLGGDGYGKDLQRRFWSYRLFCFMTILTRIVKEEPAKMV